MHYTNEFEGSTETLKGVFKSTPLEDLTYNCNIMNEKLNDLMESLKEENGIILDVARDFQSKEEMQSFYSDYGFVTLKNYIPSDLIENIVNDLRFIFEPFATDKSNPIDSGILNLDKNDKKLLHNLHMASAKSTSIKLMSGFFRDIIREINGKDDSVFEISSGLLLGISRDDRLVYNFHQESNYMRGFTNIFNIHFPLLRTSNVQNGTMSILPGTHKLCTLEYEKKPRKSNAYTNLVPKNINKIVADFPELHCYLEVGDVIIFQQDLIHKSNYNSSALCRPVRVQRLTQSISGNCVKRSTEEL